MTGLIKYSKVYDVTVWGMDEEETDLCTLPAAEQPSVGVKS